MNKIDLGLKKIFDQAFQNHQRGNLKNAEALYKKILQLKPNHLETNFFLGTLFIQRKNFYFAKKKFLKVVLINPNHFNAYNYLGIIHKELKIFDKAKEYFDKAIKLNKDYADAYYNLGILFKDLEDYKNAKKYYQKTIQVNPNHIHVYNNLGHIFSIFGKTKEAINLFKKAIEVNPKNALAYNNIGNRYKELGEYKKSIEAYNKAIEINPNIQQVYENLGNVFRIKKDFKKAIEYFKKSNSENSKAQLLECIYFQYGLKKFREKLEMYTEKDFLNRRVATISAYVSATQSLQNIYPFCKNPLKFIFFKNIKSNFIPFKKFINSLINECSNLTSVWESRTTKKGFQSKGNLFKHQALPILNLKKIILEVINEYKIKYKTKPDGFISRWPNKFSLLGWYNRLLKHGYQRPHIHPGGWLSGCFYLKMPKPLKKSEGAINFSLHGYDYPIVNSDIPSYQYSPVEGDLILFPSSFLFYVHYNVYNCFYFVRIIIYIYLYLQSNYF